MKHPSIHLLDAMFRVLFGAFLVIFPLAAAPILFTPTLPRTALVISMGMLSAFYLVARWVLLRQIAMTVTPFTVPLSLLTAVAAGSSAVSQTPFLEALHGVTGEWIALFLVFLAAVEAGTFSFVPLQIGAVLLSIVHLEAAFGFLKGFAAFRWISAETPWTPLGNPWIAVAVMGIGAVVSAVSFIQRKRTGHVIAAAVSMSGILATLVSSFRQPMPTPVVPPFSASWYVAVETLRSKPLLGVGSGQYEDGFTAGRPFTMNDHSGWDMVFETGSSEVLTLATEMGMVGIVALAFLATRTFVGAAWLLTAEAQGGVAPGSVASFAFPFATTVASLFLLPMRDVGWVLLVVLLSRASHLLGERHALGIWMPFADVNAFSLLRTRRPSLTATHVALLVFSLTLLALGFVRIGRVLASDYRMKLALELGEKGSGSETYRLQSGVVEDRPENAAYRLTFARTNLQVADALIRNRINSTKSTNGTNSTGSIGKTLSDEDRQTIQKLLSESIQQAKSVTMSYPQRARGWRTLASIYRAVISVTDSASSLALEGYREAIIRDPTNPQLYRERGLVSYEVGNYDLAVEDFRRAVSLKNDWGEAWFSLGQGYEKAGKNDYARQAYQQTQRVSHEGSDEYRQATEALKQFEPGFHVDPSPTPTVNQGKASAIPTRGATPTQTPEPERSPTPTPTAVPTAVPTATVTPTIAPTGTPTPSRFPSVGS